MQKKQRVVFSRIAPCAASNEGSYQVSCSSLSGKSYCLYYMVFSTGTQLNAVRLKSAVDKEAQTSKGEAVSCCSVIGLLRAES